LRLPCLAAHAASRRINNTIRARTASLGETTNMNFGGAGKTTYTVK
jgi:hypothetical protein